jgi:hypothetical protein
MSLLQQSSQEVDDAARGEEFTKGSGHVAIASIVAAVLVSIAVFLYVRLGEKPPVATGEVSNVVAHLMHRETAGVDASGTPMPKDVFDQVLVFAHVKLKNQSKQPLFLHQIMADATLNDGIHTSYAASTADYERIFAGYPDLAPLHGKPLSYDRTLEAGEAVEGEVVSAFRMSKPEWDGRKDLNFTFAFRYQPNLKVIPTGTLSDR